MVVGLIDYWLIYIYWLIDWLKERKDERKKELWMDEWIDGKMGGRVSGWVEGLMDWWIIFLMRKLWVCFLYFYIGFLFIDNLINYSYL